MSQRAGGQLVCKERELPCGLCCPSHDNGCTATEGAAGGELESPGESPARKEAVNILLESLSACDEAG